MTMLCQKRGLFLDLFVYLQEWHPADKDVLRHKYTVKDRHHTNILDAIFYTN